MTKQMSLALLQLVSTALFLIYAGLAEKQGSFWTFAMFV